MDIGRFFQWVGYYTSNYFFTKFWRDAKFEINSRLHRIPPQQKGEYFDKYLARLNADQALRVMKYLVETWQGYTDLMEAADITDEPMEKRFKMSARRREVIEDRKTLEDMFQEVLQRSQKEKQIS
ncbi:MAG: hypothetical protein Q8O75_00840 [bacterium]|nr:hypothetical protein [bacterium]